MVWTRVACAAFVGLLAACSGSFSKNGGKAGGSVLDGGDGVLVPPPDFEVTSAASYTAKVKNILTGLPPTDDEISAVTADPKALRSLVDAWLATPQAQAKLLTFFGKAFQQVQFNTPDLSDQLVGDGPQGQSLYANDFTVNMRESFPRTALELMNEGRPFTESMTTHRFMVTPAVLSFLALADERTMSDDNKLSDGMYVADKTWSFKVEQDGGTIPVDQTVAVGNANYMKWSVPVVFPNGCTKPERVFPGTTNNTLLLYDVLYGNIQQDPSDPTCTSFNTTAQYVPADFTSWRMVTIRPPTSGEATTRFFDLPTLRTANEIVLNIPRAGFFTTPAYFANWPTNSSNQARVTTNQTLIVALGKSIDPANTTIPVSEDGLDAEHAGPTTACYACHVTLDPMRNFFRKNYTLTYHVQKDATQTATQPQFAFDGVTATGNTVDDFAQMLANHPRVASAWVQKLCFYADSAACSEDDVEFQRIVTVFKSSNYNFKTLIGELMASPLITGASYVKTLGDRGVVISVARYDHLCAALNNRLGLTNACTASTKAKSLATNIPSDAYSRGAEIPVLNSDTSLFFRSATENLCRLVADQVVDATGSKYASAKKDDAIADLVANLMGLPASDPRAAPAAQILNDHYAAAVKLGASPTNSLKSVFTLACTSPTAVAVGL